MAFKLRQAGLVALIAGSLGPAAGARESGALRDAEAFIRGGAYEEAGIQLRAEAAAARDARDTARLAACLPLAGDALLLSGEAAAAILAYEEARAAAIEVDRDRDADLLGRLGGAYLALGRNDRARQHLDRALAGHASSGRSDLEARDLRTSAELAARQGDFLAARRALDRARSLDAAGRPDALAADLSALAGLLEDFGQEERADVLYHEAQAVPGIGQDALFEAVANRAEALAKRERFDLAMPLFQEAQAGFAEGGLAVRSRRVALREAEAYRRAGQADKAVATLDAVVGAARAGARQGEVAEALRLRGFALTEIGRHDAALADLREAVGLFRLLERPEHLAGGLTDLGNALLATGQGAEAAQAYSEAIAGFTALDRRDRQADVEKALGDALLAGGKLQSARSAFERSVGLGRQAGEAAEALRLEAAGISLARHLHLREAADWFARAVAIRERARERTVGFRRRDYLASQIRSYDLLIGARLLGGDLAGAVDAFEESRGRWLSETLRAGGPPATPASERSGGPPATQASARSGGPRRATLAIARAALAPKSAILLYVDAPPLGAWVVCIRREAVRFAPIPGSGGAALARDIETFREELQSPAGAARSPVSRRLHSALIGPAAPFLGGSGSVVVIPDGALAFLPFEALRDESGRYLVERFSMTYAPSLTVLRLLEGRKASPDRKPLLAFGNPEYAPATPESAGGEAPFEVLRRRAYDELDRGAPLGNLYGALGLGTWPPLPGTLREVERIAGLFPGAQRLTGRAVDEREIKRMGRDGTLARYRMLHFAMHGIAVPEVPELSALVSSLPGSQRWAAGHPGAVGGGHPASAEDGYLRAGEVAELALAADFVNLSACETALGKLVRGEGVQSLAQAFLVAGARGVSASLWPVSDEGTARFMEALYRDIAGGKAPAGALSDVKRRFIAGEFGKHLAQPYYWAPFVYHGV